jgi:diguanylate cyclase (GGDEF)-like protein
MEQSLENLSTDVVLQLIQHLPVGLLISDNVGTVVWCNQLMSGYLGKKQNEIIGSSLSKLQSSKLRPISEHSDTVLVPGVDNQPDRWLKHQAIALDDGEKHMSATVYTDITEVSSLLAEQEKLTEQLNQLSTVDSVSGLLNHRAMLQNLEPLVSRSRRYHNPLSIIAMELLNLDIICREHGQEGADFAVVNLSRLLKDQMRWADVVSRIEDSRFLFILPETEKSAALHLANKLSAQVSELEIHYKEYSYTLEASFGVTGWEKGNDTVLLLRRANQALDYAKAKGHNAIEAC